MVKNLIQRAVLVVLAAFLPLLAGIVMVRVWWSAIFNIGKGWDILIAADRVLNVSANGSIGQTISKRAADARANKQRWGCILCNFLDEIDPGPPAHCDRALIDAKQNLKE